MTPDPGWTFAGWVPALPATITADAATTAQYVAAGPVPPDGEFLAALDANAVTLGRGLWDLSGTYATTVAGRPLAMTMVHDPTGRLTGTATYAVAEAAVVTMPIKGSAKGSAGSVVVRLALTGADPAHGVAVSLTLNLTVDTANRRLTGPATGGITTGAASTPVAEVVTVAVPQPMDGTWTLAFQLDQAGRRVAGTASLTLSSGVDHAFVVQGRAGGANAVLSLAGAPADPAPTTIRIRTTMTPLEGGSARLERLSGRGYGQSLLW